MDTKMNPSQHKEDENRESKNHDQQTRLEKKKRWFTILRLSQMTLKIIASDVSD